MQSCKSGQGTVRTLRGTRRPFAAAFDADASIVGSVRRRDFAGCGLALSRTSQSIGLCESVADDNIQVILADCGLSTELTSQAPDSWAFRSSACRQQAVESSIAALRSVGLGDAALRELVQLEPRLLFSHVAEWVQFLRAMGLSDYECMQFVRYWADVCCVDVHQAGSVILLFKSYGLTDCDIRYLLLQRNPRWLLYNTATDITALLNEFTSLGIHPSRAVRLLLDIPPGIVRDLPAVSAVLHILSDNFQDAAQLVTIRPNLLSLTSVQILQNVQFLRSSGFSQSDLDYLVQVVPEVLLLPFWQLKLRWFMLSTVLCLERADMLEYSACWLHDPFLQLLPRLKFAEFVKRTQRLCPEPGSAKLNPRWLLQSSDRCFCELLEVPVMWYALFKQITWRGCRVDAERQAMCDAGVLDLLPTS